MEQESFEEASEENVLAGLLFVLALVLFGAAAGLAILGSSGWSTQWAVSAGAFIGWIVGLMFYITPEPSLHDL